MDFTPSSLNHHSKNSEKEYVLNMHTFSCHSLSNTDSTASIYIALTMYKVIKIIQKWFKEYERICVGYMQIPHHILQGTWASSDFGI